MRIRSERNDREEPGSIDPLTIRRRSLIKGAAALAGAAAASVLQPVSGAADPPRTQPSTAGACNTLIAASNENAIVETSAGKVRGFTRNGINTFLGIPYAGSTDGKARFQAPTKPVPWTGLRSSMQYGFVSPQEPRAGWADDEVAWMFDWDDGRPGEDCLRVNIWTPEANASKKRPVMVWLHGGGFSAGSGQELKSYYGENLSRRGDVVVVSLNHRLGVLGYLNLAEIGGAAYADSANAGMLDIVAALEWVRDNIANFRRRSRQRDDLRAVGRRRQGQHADGHAGGQRVVPSSSGREWLAPECFSRGRFGQARRGRDAATRPKRVADRSDPRCAGREADSGGNRRCKKSRATLPPGRRFPSSTHRMAADC